MSYKSPKRPEFYIALSTALGLISTWLDEQDPVGKKMISSVISVIIAFILIAVVSFIYKPGKGKGFLFRRIVAWLIAMITAGFWIVFQILYIVDQLKN